MKLIDNTRSYAYKRSLENLEGQSIPFLINVTSKSNVPFINSHKIFRQFLGYYSGTKMLSGPHFEIYSFVKKPPIVSLP
jgi:hypothetical protein